MRKGSGSAYDKWNMSVVICDTYMHTFLMKYSQRKGSTIYCFNLKGNNSLKKSGQNSIAICEASCINKQASKGLKNAYVKRRTFAYKLL